MNHDPQPRRVLDPRFEIPKRPKFVYGPDGKRRELTGDEELVYLGRFRARGNDVVQAEEWRAPDMPELEIDQRRHDFMRTRRLTVKEPHE